MEIKKSDSITPMPIKPVEKKLTGKKVLGKTATKMKVQYVDLNEGIVVFDLIEVTGTAPDTIENVLASDRYIKLSDLPFTITKKQKDDLAKRIPIINRKEREKKKGDGTKITNI